MTGRSAIKRLRHIAEAAGFVLLMGVLRPLGLRGASWFGGKVTRAIGPLIPVTRTARRNLTMSFPNLTEHEVDLIVTDMWENLGRTFTEFSHLDKYDAFSGSGYIATKGKDVLEWVKSNGKGAIFISGHFANWEVLPLIGRGYGLTGTEVYRVANNLIVDKWIIQKRKKYILPSQTPKGKAGTKQLVRVLRDRQHIAMLVDQKMNEGISLPFLGHEAMTSDGAARLALSFGCPIVPVGIRRVNGPELEITVFPPLEIAPTGNRDGDVSALTRQMNAWLEDRIREAPAQWLWVHNRWPKAAKPSLLGSALPPEAEA